MPRLFRFVLGASLAGFGSAFGAIESRSIPLALRAANPDMLSGGLFAALDADGAFASTPPMLRVRAGMIDASKGKPPAVLDARVGANVRLGDDPAPLPPTQAGQAEPHIYRSTSNPLILLATFQEGRFSDAGALDCGYAVSTDGGLTWARGLIPQLTQASGGLYNRATDPVAAIGPQGDMYLNTLASTSGAFSSGAVVVSRSTDNGVSWSAPVVVSQSTSSQVSPDKNWIAVNDYTGVPNTGRIVVTWTNFTSTATGNATGNNLLTSVSDDRGATWSTPVAITPAGSVNQGTQPVFLPDGSLVVVYITFPNPSTTGLFLIECKRSLDGGRTFPAVSTLAVPTVVSWDDPVLRDGVFLPAATAARQTGDLFVTYTAVAAGTPRVFVTKSTDRGASWSMPVIASDNPAGVSVVNPAIAVSPDGRTVSVVFLDKRNAPDGSNFIDTYAALSFDGGVTWQPNVRLSDLTSDIRFATSTTRGYMLGDYQGVAPALASDQPCVAIWCDARTGDADPFTVRFTPTPSDTIEAWSIAHGVGGAAEDADGDGMLNGVEFRLGTNPRARESGESFVVRQSGPGVFDVAWVERVGGTGFPVTTVANQPVAGPVDISAQLPSVAPAADQLPALGLSGNLRWSGLRFTAPPGDPLSVGHALRISIGVPSYVSGEIAWGKTDSRLVNVSTRGTVGTAANQMIVGFVVDGQKNMLVRAAGPSLTVFGVPGTLANPQLAFSATGATTAIPATAATLQESATTAARVGAFAFPIPGPDAAMLQSVPAGSYTAVVSGANGGTGAALVEAYDADANPGAPTGPRLVNLSTRGVVGPGTVFVAGFVIRGSQPRRVLIRAVGPTLSSFDVIDNLADPVLTLTTASGVAIATNDDWEISRSGPAIAATAQRLGAFGLNPGSLDSALLITLPPGAYTATVGGVNDSAGIALVEVYDAD